MNKLLNDWNIDFLDVSETWLTPSVTDSFISIPGYEIARHDSPSNRCKHGVSVYIKNVLKYEIINCDVDNVLIVCLTDLNLYIVTIYRPPSYNLIENMKLVQFIESFCFGKEVVVQGDFNLPDVDWISDSSSNSSSHLGESFYNAFVTVGLNQIIDCPTIHPSGNILDLFFTSDLERIGSYEVLHCLPNCAHSPVLVNYIYQFLPDSDVASNESSSIEYLWSRGRFDLLSRCLADVDWESELDTLLPDAQYCKFLNIIHPLIDRFVPVKVPSAKSPFPWTKNPPRQLTRERNDAWHAYKSVRFDRGRSSASTIEAWDLFKHTNDLIRNFAIHSQKQYESSLSDQLSTNPKLFHSYIRHRKTGKPTVGPLRLDNGNLTDDPVTMASCFANSFSSVFNNVLPDNPSPHQTSSQEMDDIMVTPEIVHDILSSLNPNSSLGEDGVHPRFLKLLCDNLSFPLTLIYNSSLQTGIVPVEWLCSVVVPIFKKSSRFDPLNYRPISLTSVPCKVLERIVVLHITRYLNENSIISDHQYGFRAGHSTVDQLILTYNEISTALDNGNPTDLIFFDFSKAFDLVNHVILLVKLHHIGIAGQVCEWIAAFLSGRSMKVRVAGALSHTVPVTSGVPQGSVLGPLLFLIYINHIVHGLGTKYKIFADDLKIYLAFDGTGDSNFFTEALQADVDHLVSTSSSWGLSLNFDKCAVIRFTPGNSNLPYAGVSPYMISGQRVKFVDSHKDLGILVDRSLKFHAHIRQKVGMVSGLTTNLLSCTLNRDADFLMNIFKSHVRPILDYASPLWNLHYVGDVKLLERVQRRWTKAVTGLSDMSYYDRLRRLDLFSYQGRLLRADLILVWKILHHQCAIDPTELFSFSSYRSTRGHQMKLFLPRVRTEIRRKFFSVRVISVWNSLSPDTVSSETLNMFKGRLHSDLGDKLFEFAQ